MRLFKTSWFEKFARKEKISDAALCDAVRQAEAGLIDADLGNGVIKQRVARPGAGKSGGYRTIILYRTQTRALFVYGFAKSDRDNLSAEETVVYRKIAKIYLGLTDDEMASEVKAGAWTEIEYDD